MIYVMRQTVPSVSLLMMGNWKEWLIGSCWHPEGLRQTGCMCFLEPHDAQQGEVQSPATEDGVLHIRGFSGAHWAGKKLGSKACQGPGGHWVKRKANDVLSCIRESINSRLREDIPFIQHCLGNTKSYVMSSALPSTKEIWSFWRLADERPQKWWTWALWRKAERARTA